MDYNEILREYIELRKKKQIIVVSHQSIRSMPTTGVFPRWCVCIDYSFEPYQNDKKVSDLTYWPADSLSDAIEVVAQILLKDGYTHNEINSDLEKNITDLKLRNRDKLYVCYYHIKGDNLV